MASPEAQLRELQEQSATLINQIERLAEDNAKMRQEAIDKEEEYLIRFTAAEDEILKMKSAGDRGQQVRFVDMRNVQPPTYTGKEPFKPWTKKSKAFLESQLDGIAACLDEAARTKEVITEDWINKLGTMKIDKWAMVDRRLFIFLTMYCDGAALTFVESAQGSGFDAWRRLHAEYDPASTQKNFTKMGSLMQPKRAKTTKEVSACIEVWERDYREYTDKTANKFPEDMLIEVMLNMMPDEIGKHFRTYGRDSMKSYSVLRAALMDHAHVLIAADGRTTHRPTGMDMSPLDRAAAAHPETPTAPAPEEPYEWQFEDDPTAALDYDTELNYV